MKPENYSVPHEQTPRSEPQVEGYDVEYVEMDAQEFEATFNKTAEEARTEAPRPMDATIGEHDDVSFTPRWDAPHVEGDTPMVRETATELGEAREVVLETPPVSGIESDPTIARPGDASGIRTEADAAAITALRRRAVVEREQRETEERHAASFRGRLGSVWSRLKDFFRGGESSGDALLPADVSSSGQPRVDRAAVRKERAPRAPSEAPADLVRTPEDRERIRAIKERAARERGELETIENEIDYKANQLRKSVADARARRGG